MARKASSKPGSTSSQSSATIGFEAKLWLAADSRGEAETAEGNLRNQLFSAA